MAIECLGYVIVQTDKREEWETYLCKVVGAMKGEAPDSGADHYRVDARPFRFRIVDAGGEGERLTAAGYRIDSRDALDALAGRLESAGHPVRWGADDDAKIRGVDAFFSVADPAGNGFEFYVGDSVSDEPFVSPIGVKGFVTGELGMGHAVFAAPDFDASYKFFNEVIGFHPTDLPRFRFLGTPDDPGIPFAFLHADNGRHHSVAFGQLPPMPGGCVHLMLEMTTLEDVKDCYARMSEFGVAESASIGKHPNDKVTSFYMKTPSGFDLEIGYDGLVIDPANWETTSHDTPSEWGHEWAWMKAMAGAGA
ncbi:MAG: glyoxalase [Sphingomonas sp.]|nr:glyoxalase [Sphingomonas sp.]